MPDQTSPSDLDGAISMLFRAFSRSRERLRHQSLGQGLDWSAFSVLKPVVEDGPQRVTVLADRLQLTPSTVSRLTAHLIGEGLVERRADAGDGRAWLIAPTARGLAVYRRLCGVRREYLESVLQDWSDQERAELARVLHRLAVTVDAAANAPPRAPADPRDAPADLTPMGTP